MGVFEQFPYSNFHDLNLDWILKKIQECETDVAHMQIELDEFPAKFTEEFTVVIYQILEEAWHDLLPPVTEADDGKVMSVVAGAWAATTIPNGNVPPASYVDKNKALRVDENGDWSITGFSDLIGPYRTVSSLPAYTGILSSTGSWSSTNNPGTRHIVIPVGGGETVVLKGHEPTGTTYYSALKSHNLPLSGAADFATGYTGRVALAATVTTEFVLPADARLLYVQMAQNDNDCSPAIITINDANVYATSTAEEVVELVEKKIADGDRNTINIFKKGGSPAQLKWELGSITVGNIGTQISMFDSNTRMRTDAFYTDVDLHAVWDASISAQIIYVDSDSAKATITGKTPPQPGGSQNITIPAGSRFRMIFGYSNSSSLENVDPDSVLNILPVLYTNLSDMLYPDLVNWTALGDSISQGYYSYMNGSNPTIALNASIAWTTLVAKWNLWTLDNQSVGGSGFLKLSSSDPPVAGWQIAANHDFSDCNLVTIAYGINDWKGNQTLGTILDTIPTTPTTVIGAMQYVINKIMTDNPECKIVGILPINCSAYGTFSTNWSLNTTNGNNVTLNEFVQALIDVYEYYGIEYVDLAHSSVVNRLNIQSLLLDGVHPTIATHRLLALELAERISFKS